MGLEPMALCLGRFCSPICIYSNLKTAFSGHLSHLPSKGLRPLLPRGLLYREHGVSWRSV